MTTNSEVSFGDFLEENSTYLQNIPQYNQEVIDVRISENDIQYCNKEVIDFLANLKKRNAPYILSIINQDIDPERSAQENKAWENFYLEEDLSEKTKKSLSKFNKKFIIALGSESSHLAGMTASETLEPVVAIPLNWWAWWIVTPTWSAINMPPWIPNWFLKNTKESTSIISKLNNLKLDSWFNTIIVPDTFDKKSMEIATQLWLKTIKESNANNDQKHLWIKLQDLSQNYNQEVDYDISVTIPTVENPMNWENQWVMENLNSNTFYMWLNKWQEKVRYNNALIYLAEIIWMFNPNVRQKRKEYMQTLSNEVLQKNAEIHKSQAWKQADIKKFNTEAQKFLSENPNLITNIENEADKKSVIEIRMWSDSDISRMEDLIKGLKLKWIKYILTIYSAHRTPEEMQKSWQNFPDIYIPKLLNEEDKKELKTKLKGIKITWSIAVAWGSAHIAWQTAATTSSLVFAMGVESSAWWNIDSSHSMISACRENPNWYIANQDIAIKLMEDFKNLKLDRSYNTISIPKWFYDNKLIEELGLRLDQDSKIKINTQNLNNSSYEEEGFNIIVPYTSQKIKWVNKNPIMSRINKKWLYVPIEEKSKKESNVNIDNAIVLAAKLIWGFNPEIKKKVEKYQERKKTESRQNGILLREKQWEELRKV